MAKKDYNAAAKNATKNFFTGNEADEKDGMRSEPLEEKGKKATKKGFSFRGNPDDVTRWQNYGMAVKSTHAPAEKFRVDEIWCAAMDEYIKNHPLDGKAKELYDQYMNS